jgi:hypothetical protein
MFLFQSTAFGNNSKARSQQQQEKTEPIPLKDFTKEMKLHLGWAQKAGTRLQDYMAERSQKLEGMVWLGPSTLDKTYWFRVEGDINNTFADKTPGQVVRAAIEADGYHIPMPESELGFLGKNPHFGTGWMNQHRKSLVSDSESVLVAYHNSQGRLETANENGRLPVFKHAPGSNVNSTLIGASETEGVFISATLPQLIDGPMKPFLDMLKMPGEMRPKAMMINHCQYAAEQDLKELLGPLPSFFPTDKPLPASLSPWLSGGMMRMLGFNGLLVSDAYNMGAAGDFVAATLADSAGTAKGRTLSKMTDHTILFVQSVYAGINWALYCEPDREQVKKHYDSNPDFARLFDNLALESLFLKLKCMPASERKEVGINVEGLELPDLRKKPGELSDEKVKTIGALRAALENSSPAKSFAIKMGALLNSMEDKEHGFRPPAIKAISDYYCRAEDIWNRSGVLIMEFRKNFIEEMTGQKFKGIGDFQADPPIPSEAKGKMTLEKYSELDEQRKTAEQKFMECLFSNKDFVKAYGSVDWNGKEMKSVFVECYKKQVSGF